jgi:hypothetical protein
VKKAGPAAAELFDELSERVAVPACKRPVSMASKNASYRVLPITLHLNITKNFVCFWQRI